MTTTTHDRILKLVQLALHNPSPEEAHAAAMKVCEIIEAEETLLDTTLPDGIRVQSDGSIIFRY